MLALPNMVQFVAAVFLCLALKRGNFVFGAKSNGSAAELSSSNFPETAGVEPIPCHSHNDYLRTHPLIDALEIGCISVEADVWQQDDMKNDLRVGHTEDSLSDDRTLKGMYVQPIVQRLQAVNAARQSSQALNVPWNGIFLANKSQTLVLLIDFKTGGDKTWSTLMAALDPLRDGGWLSYWDIEKRHFQQGAITMVASGNSTLDDVMKTRFSDRGIVRRDIFLDAPLANLYASNEYDTTNSFYASTNYAKSSKSVTVEDQIATANRLHLKSRYWNAPNGEGNPKVTALWKELLKDDVGIFNVDHLANFKRWWDRSRSP